LILNDYNDLEYSDQENHIIDIVTQVVKAGGPIDAVGAQSHDVYKLSASQLQTALDTMHTKTGLPIYITEYDVSNTSDSGQLSTYQSQFPVMWKADYVHGITIWGWIYGQTWQQAANSGLVKDKAPRSAMTWLMQQLNRPVPPN
jgi:endo-1,4-beta-xylanase